MSTIKNRIVFKIKTDYKLEQLTPKTMKLLTGTKKDIDKDKTVKTYNTTKITEKQQTFCGIITEMNQVILFLLILNLLNTRQVLHEIHTILLLVMLIMMQLKLVKTKPKLL